MTSQFRDLDEFLVDEPIRLPIRGKTYSFPGSIPARTGLLLQRLGAAADKARTSIKAGAANPAELAAEVFSDSEETDLRAEIMGPAEQEMADDGLTTAHTSHVFRTLMVWHMAGEEAAMKAWEAVGPQAAPNRAARRAASKASGSTTKRRASTSGTSTPTPAGAPTG
jgi:hypothetical protein